MIVIGEESIKNKEPREKKRKRLHDSSNEEKWPGETGHLSRSEPKPRRGNISVEETELANYRGIEINADRFRGNLGFPVDSVDFPLGSRPLSKINGDKSIRAPAC